MANTGELDKHAVAECQQMLESLVTSLLREKPDDPVPHIIQYLHDKKGTGAAPLSRDEQQELNQLRDEFKKLKTKKASIKRNSVHNVDVAAVAQALSSDSEDEQDQKGSGKDGDASSSDSAADEEFLDEINEPLSPLKQQDKIKMAQKARISVSAEVFGKYNMKEAFVAKVIPKSQEIKNKIKERLSGAFMFMGLEEKDLQVVIDAMD